MHGSSPSNLDAGEGVGVGLVAGREVGGVGGELDQELSVDEGLHAVGQLGRICMATSGRPRAVRSALRARSCFAGCTHPCGPHPGQTQRRRRDSQGSQPLEHSCAATLVAAMPRHRARMRALRSDMVGRDSSEDLRARRGGRGGRISEARQALASDWTQFKNQVGECYGGCQAAALRGASGRRLPIFKRRPGKHDHRRHTTPHAAPRKQHAAAARSSIG